MKYMCAARTLHMSRRALLDMRYGMRDTNAHERTLQMV